MRGKGLRLLAGVVGALLMLGAACAPKGTPVAPPAPAAQPAPVSRPAPATPAISPEEAAWGQVVAAAKKEGKVTLYSFSFTGDLAAALAKTFKTEYGISVDIIAGSGAVFLERIKTESRAGQYVADILEGAATNGVLAKQSKLSQAYGFLPALEQKGVWMFDPLTVDPEGHLLYYSPTLSTPWINTKLVSRGEEPRSWKDLLLPKWRGKILVIDPDSMPTPNIYYILLTRYLGFDDDYFRALGKQDLIIAPNQRDSDSKLARGESPLAYSTSLAAVSRMVADGAPIAPLDMREGVQGWAQTVNLVANAPHPNAARLFTNWLLAREGQTANAKIRSNLPLRTDVPDFSPEPARIKFTKIIPFTAKDTEDAAGVQRQRVLSRLWGRQ